ncbi:hypothetical protein H8E06_00100 [bacterium]|nr:hypothetical protein [bacterium]
MKVNELIKEIDYEVISLEPAIDDYDAGKIEGLKLAREIIINRPAQAEKTPPAPSEEQFRYHTRVM